MVGYHLLSSTYLQVILEGAKEHSLPASYLEKLHKIEHNGRVGDGSVEVVLGRF